MPQPPKINHAAAAAADVSAPPRRRRRKYFARRRRYYKLGATSGVTKVGITQCGKLMASPYFFLKKLTTIFSHRPLNR